MGRRSSRRTCRPRPRTSAPASDAGPTRYVVDGVVGINGDREVQSHVCGLSVVLVLVQGQGAAAAAGAAGNGKARQVAPQPEDQR